MKRYVREVSGENDMSFCEYQVSGKGIAKNV